MRRTRLEDLCLMSLALVIVATMPQSFVYAGTIVVPNSLAASEGNINNGFPFNLTLFGQPSMRYQQVFAASDFASLAQPELVTQIAFRPDAFFGNPFFATLNNVQINLSTTNAAPDGLSSLFAANVGVDDTVVFSGPLTLSSADAGPAGGPKAFDIVINLQTPFLYDPLVGNLLLDVRNFSGGSTTQFDAEISALDPVSRSFSLVGGVSSTLGFLDSAGLVAQFTTIPFDSDGDGVLDADDVCPATTIPESVPTSALGVNRFALVDGDGLFDTTAPHGGGNGPGLSFTLEDTAGCSCEQIIERLGLGMGHAKFGCSISAMQEWLDLLND